VIEAITDADFEARVLGSDRPVVVDFWAAWCAPCRMIEPAVQELAAELGDRALFFKMDIDANSQVPAALGLRYWPTVMIFSEGRPAGSQVGYRHDIKDALSQHLRSLLS
jgi:thioredoxin 1